MRPMIAATPALPVGASPTPAGDPEPVLVSTERLIQLVRECSRDLPQVRPDDVIAAAFQDVPVHASEDDLALLVAEAAAARVLEDPEYSQLAARLLAARIAREVAGLDVASFSDGVALSHRVGLIADPTAEFVARHADVLDRAIDDARTDRFGYFGLRTIYDRYLLRHPELRLVLETPQYFLLRVACGLSETPDEALQLYELMSSLSYLPSTPTLFNSGTRHAQMSSCYLLDSPEDDLEAIYRRYLDIAKLSKFAGGIGLAFHRVRSRGSLIRGTNGLSTGLVPWLKTLDSSVAAVNQGGKRKGACAVYLETWHADIEEFLELRDNTGDQSRRAYNLNLANWVPDLFMRRVEEDGTWSLFDPKIVPHLTDLYGEAFERAYEAAEAGGLASRQLRARDLYLRMIRTLAETGNGWFCFKDACNRRANQTAVPGRIVHSSNLCTEIVELTSQAETAVCNLGSINLAHHVHDGAFDFDKLALTARTAITFLDRVIDRNYYPTEEAAVSNRRWRPVGLGIMGLQDAFFQLRLAFDSVEAAALSRRIQEEIYYQALAASCELAEHDGPFPAFAETRTAAGELQFDLWDVVPEDSGRWAELKRRIARHGLRNALLVAIAPTATIASIAGCYESIEPQLANVFKRETLSGEFLQLNPYLARDLRSLGLWNADVRRRILHDEGSVQSIVELPAEVRTLYRTAWELPMRAVIDLAAERGPFIDQSQSLNLFVESPTIGKLSSMYAYAWRRGLKTTYYLRSRPATRIAKTTAQPAAASCSRDEACESCQ